MMKLTSLRNRWTRFFARYSTQKEPRAQILLVGAGRMGQIRAKILHSNPRVDLCGVADTAGKGGHLASMYRIPEYQSLEEACENQARPLDAVVVCTPTHSHSEVILLAASYGLDTFVEKPVAESASAIEDLFESVSQVSHSTRPRPVALCCGFQRRFDPSYQAAMTSAAFGKPITARIFFGDHPVPPIEFLLTGGDIFMDLAAHDVDYITHVWKDDRVESVFAVASASSPQLAEAGVQNHATVLLQFEGGAVATLFLSRSSVYGYDQRCELFGTEGLVSIGNIPEHSTTIRNKKGSHGALWQHSFPQRFEHAFANELDAFVNTVLLDEPWPVSRDQCLYVQSIVDAAQRSAKLGEVVRLTAR
ncbi:hypothetical protein FisN_12Lh315 [Fistulifera solaris]|uniref:Inositol 2-dehydrogenase n=1 Tax=Fistulifera solaris TaxID=1519565 RepID=A0A1Z5JLU9_FISSO|nr:hypothetical protein FisN_12Lh315 [Fistulifera solaris]|eukprot:GAX14990.1 hypothetical protein FisN_12Lh315 [Fistulifera solaris]